MKNSNVTFALAIIVLASLFTSCQKESLVETQEEEITEEITIDFLSDDTQDEVNELNGVDNTFEVNIVTSDCGNEGFLLTVQSAGVNLDPNEYEITWYKNSQQTVYATGALNECVCGVGFRVKVKDINNDLMAEASLDIPSC